MKNFYIALIATPLIFVLGIAQADEDGVIKRGYCSEGNQLEMNYCDGERFEQADKEMNRLYKEQLAKLTLQKERDRLRDAQRAWVAFRDKVCLYEVGPREESGSIWVSSQSACMTYRTKLRIKDLKEYLACDTGGCP